VKRSTTGTGRLPKGIPTHDGHVTGTLNQKRRTLFRKFPLERKLPGRNQKGEARVFSYRRLQDITKREKKK
jgi:hypothetical protein